MSFISYAQNFEDVMLWRALKHIERGFYLDVGANDPIEDSITKAFYDHGWSGINIEPLSTHIQALNSQRPRDTNLQFIVSDVEEPIELWESEVRGWASAHPDVIKKHLEKNHQGHYITVSSITLSSVCEQYKPQNIHFLKIDVEGLEAAVLRSNDWHRFRPWIVIVEATQPLSQIDSYVEWEPLLIDHDYAFAYADGLNRFYVAQEHKELLAAFKSPPNVFDDFIKQNEHDLLQKVGLLNQQLIDIQNKCSPEKPTEAQQQVIELQSQLIDVQKHAIEAHLQASKTHQHMLNLQERLHVSDRKRTQTVNELEKMQADLSTSAQKLNDLNQNCHHWYVETHAAQQQVRDLLNSRSWRVTKPLRAVSLAAQYAKQGVKNIIKPPLKATMAFALKNPTIRQKSMHWLDKNPSIKARLRLFGMNQGLIAPPMSETLEKTAEFSIAQFAQLPPHAQAIYKKLKSQTQTH